MTFSVILTAYKEEKTIAKAIESICDPKYSGVSEKFQLVTVIPDKPTNKAAARAVNQFKHVQWTKVLDPGKGKPTALNLGLQKAKGKIIVLTDGDVYFHKNTLKYMLKSFENRKVMGATGRPMSLNSRSTFWGYISQLLVDAAHHKRLTTLKGIRSGNSQVFVGSKSNFFVLSGYILAMRNIQLQLPEDTLVDDAYISYELLRKGGKLEYVPQAQVFVNYPTNLRDWYLQKLRSVGGYVQLWKYGVVNDKTKVRNFKKELEYVWFPIKYAKGIKELIWSLILYPMRLVMWLIIFYQQRIRHKSLEEIWKRVDSTK